MKGSALPLTFAVTAASALAVPPTIHVSWDESPAPQLGFDYFIDTSDPDFPDLELAKGSLTWKIWSVDTDNTGNVGDIGVISSPAAEDFAIRIRNDGHANLTGARHVKAISLLPTSSSNHSSVLEARITGQVSDEITVTASSGGSGGVVEYMLISEAVTADITIPTLSYLGISDEVSGTIVVGELRSQIDIGVLSGTLQIGRANGECTVRVFVSVTGSISIDEIENDAAEFFVVYNPGGVEEGGSWSFGEFDLGGAAILGFGSEPGAKHRQGLLAPQPSWTDPLWIGRDAASNRGLAEREVNDFGTRQFA